MEVLQVADVEPIASRGKRFWLFCVLMILVNLLPVSLSRDPGRFYGHADIGDSSYPLVQCLVEALPLLQNLEQNAFVKVDGSELRTRK